jgi:uncharacterized protein (TIGR03435 family)
MRAILAVLGLMVLAASLIAQAPAIPRFESASVRRNKSENPSANTRTQDGSFDTTNAPVQLLILEAFQIQPSQLEGGPVWLNSDRFDIQAKTPPGAPQSETPAMLRSLLAARFKLQVHTERRETSTYLLVLANADGMLGPKLRRSACKESPKAEPSPPCGDQSIAVGRIFMTGASTIEWVGRLAQLADLTLQDRTGLKGNLDVELTWRPDKIRPGFPPFDPNAPPLDTALREQLGLKLEVHKSPYNALVVDSAELPSEN